MPTFRQSVGILKRKCWRGGILYEILAVTGYEEERGNWATAYNNMIRFGTKTIPVQVTLRPVDQDISSVNFYFSIGKQLVYDLLNVVVTAGDVFYTYLPPVGVIGFQVLDVKPEGNVLVILRTSIIVKLQRQKENQGN